MQILTFKDIDREAWSRLVETSATGNWFQSRAAYEFYASQPELFKPFVYGVENNGELRGVCVGYVTVEKSVLKQMMTRRAIIVGGPVLADDCTEEEACALMQAVRQQLVIGNWKLVNAPIYIECRNFNDYSRWKDAFEKAGFEYVPHLNFHIDTSSMEVVDANLGKSRKRDIRTSLRDGATIIEKPTLEQVREYYAILEHLYKTRVKTPLFPFSFFEKLWKHKDGRFILVALNNEIIGGAVCVIKEPTSDSSLKGREETTQESFAKVWGAHTADSTQYELLEANARENRKNPTEAESVLWGMLKGNGIGLHFRRQHVILDYIVDFFCMEKGLIIELDGGYHNVPEQKEKDEQRTAHLTKLGYTELRFSNEELLCDPESVIAKIKETAERLKPTSDIVLRTAIDSPIEQSSSPVKGREETTPTMNNGVLYEWFACGRDGEWKTIFPSTLATYSGIRYAAEHGCARFDMMGAGKPDEAYGVRDFKAKFGGEEVEHGRFLCITKPLLYRIGVLGVKLLKKLK